MKTVDFGSTIVIYNIVIGALLMLSSKTVGSLAGNLGGVLGPRTERYTYLSTLTLGGCIAFVSAFVYIVFWVFRFGVAI